MRDHAANPEVGTSQRYGLTILSGLLKVPTVGGPIPSKLMKRLFVRTFWLSISFFLLNTVLPVQGQSNTYSVNIVGYVSIYFLPGDNLFGNPLDNTPNNLATLFPSAPVG